MEISYNIFAGSYRGVGRDAHIGLVVGASVQNYFSDFCLEISLRFSIWALFGSRKLYQRMHFRILSGYKRKGPGGMSNRSLQDSVSKSAINLHRASDGVDDGVGNGHRNSTHDSRRGDSKLVDGSIDIRTRDYSSRGHNSRTRNTQVHHRK
jgi:hypothetical protein